METEEKQKTSTTPAKSERSACFLYRILQHRYTDREKIKRDIFPYLIGRSLDSTVSQVLKPMIDFKWLEEKDGIIYATKKGRSELLNMLSTYNLTKVPEYSDKFKAIERDYIEDPPKKINDGFQKDHHLLVADAIIHFGWHKTDSKISLKVHKIRDINPDQTIIKDDAYGFIEVENKGDIEYLKGKIIRYIRYYFLGDFHKQFDKEYMRVFVIETNENKKQELIRFLMNLTYKDVGFTKPFHESNPYVGRNLFRFAGTDFKWVKASEPETYRDAWR